MAKMDIKTLLSELNKDLSRVAAEPSNWEAFLKSAAWNYKYSFYNQLLIYSQRPDATACADFNVWNTRLHRYVAKGSKGIAVLNASGDKVSYVFDVSDTRSSNDETLKLWHLEVENYADVLTVLNAEHEFNCKTIEDAVVCRINEYVDDSATLFLPEGDIRENSDFINAFNEYVKHSSYVVTLLRCGFEEAANAYVDLYFKNINDVFDTNDKIIALGTAVSSVSEAVLREIELNVKAVNKAKLKSNVENKQVEVVDNGNDIQTGRGVSNSGDFTRPEGSFDRENRENGNAQIEISSSQQADSLHDTSNAGRVGATLDGDRGDGESAEGTIGSESTGLESGTNEERESDGLGSTHELDSTDSRGNSEEGIDFSLDVVSFPTVEEQKEIIENAVEVSEGFELSQEDIDFVLTSGSGFVDGKYRIYDYFLEKHTAKEKAEFLKNEYGIGGSTIVFFDGVWGSKGMDAKGLSISKYGSMSEPDLVLSWAKVQKRIGELIKAGQYFNEKELSAYSAYTAEKELRSERFSISQSFTDLVHDYNDFLRENGQEDSLLNNYVLIVGCASEFANGHKMTYLGEREGQNILLLMREALSTIAKAEDFRERAEAVLVSLQGDVVKDFEPSDEALETVKDEYVLVPTYKVGDLFFNGATKYNVVEISESSVYISEVDFEINSMELSVDDFEKIIKENPSNNHLVRRVSVEEYNSQTEHAKSIINEVEKDIIPSENFEPTVIDMVRVGDFYEMRGKNALRVANDLDLVLTGINVDGERVPMVGFPYYVLDNYNERAEAQGFVFREVPLKEKEASESAELDNEIDVDKVDELVVSRNSLVARNYDALYRLASGVLNGDYDYLRFEHEGLEPLTIERVGNNFVSIMHSFVQNGDVMRDPDVVVSVDNINKAITSVSYEMSSIGSYKEYMDFKTGELIDEIGQKKTDSFLSDWFKNIERQQYVLVRGEKQNGDIVRFDKDGNEILDEVPEGVKERFQLRIYRPYSAPDTVKAYVCSVTVPLEEGHIVEDERELYESREAAENEAENFNTVFGFDEEFRNDVLNRVPAPVLHRYYSTQRPVGPGTYPRVAGNEPVDIVNFDDREFQEHIGRAAWGYLEFERALTSEQAEDYELVKAPSEVGEEKEENNTETASVGTPEEDYSDNRNKSVVFEGINNAAAVSDNKEFSSLIPIVYCEWSEHEGLEDGREYSFVEFNALMGRLDAEVVALKEEFRAAGDYYPYFKTRFTVRFPDGYEYTGRQDIGDGEGSLLDHIRKTSEYNLKRIKEDGFGGLYSDEERDSAIRDLEKFLAVYVPLLEKEVKDNELSYDKEAYQLGYGSLGNGTTVWNSVDVDREANDYRTIAHISDDGTVRFYVDDLPKGVKAEVKDKAVVFSADYIKSVVDLPESKFKFWYLKEMLAIHPAFIPGRDFTINDYKACYNALHNDGFVRDVEVSLISQLESLSNNLLVSSKETKKDVVEKIQKGELSESQVADILNNVDVAHINNADDVYDVLAKKFVDEPLTTLGTNKASNFKIKDNNLGVGGPKEKYRNNVVAIRLLKQLGKEGRQATVEEQEVLSKYVGWGGLDAAFDDYNSSWANEYNELQELLSTEEYRSAKASTLSSFYTQPVVINAIYDGLHNLGFKRGNILEPSCGVGNFFGMLPDEFSDSKLYGVELDSISGRIAKQLYPEAKIVVKGYEDTNFKDGFFDVAVGNVPFGQFKVNDKDYNKLNYLIHDYFFAKTLDKVRPGGVVAFITSKGTMDKQNPEVRKYIAQRAELLGAIRLPNNAFLANAGTKATSDIIFLKKRDKALEVEPEWVHLGLTEDDIPINSYFVVHPEMVLGHMEMERMQYGREDSTCAPIPGASLEEQLKNAVKNIQGELSLKAFDFDEGLDADNSTDNDLVVSILADPNVRNFSYTLVDDDVYYRLDNEMIKQEFNPTREKRVRGLIEIRESLRHLIDLQRYDYSDEEIEAEQRKLNKLYDEFTNKYGLINSRGNSMAFEDDSSYYLLCSLENVDEKGELISKADMFTKKTIKKHVPVLSVGTASEALSVCISAKAKVDLDFMSQLTDMPKEKIVEDLVGVIYRVPGEEVYDGEPKYVTSDEYLSGNVREKLEVARNVAENDHSFDVNVLALEKVIPKDLGPQDISVRLGSIWVPDDVVNEFMWELLETPKGYRSNEPDVKAHYNAINGSWVVENSNWYGYGVLANSTFGTRRISAYEIIEQTLNLKTVEIYDYEENEKGNRIRVLNKDETVVAQQKQEAIKNAFADWIWQDPERRQRLVRLYNDRFNSTKPREYNGEHLVFEGINPEITLMEHQKNAVAHAIYGGNTLLAHEVGAGKTFEMTAIAMESKRLGLCSKSLMVVPNHLIGQWASEFYQLYPSANLLVASKKDFTPANRKKFCSRIATGDYDAIIIGHSQFEKIPLSVDLQKRFIQEELDEVIAGIEELSYENGNRASVKSLEKTRKSLELRLEKLNDIEQDDVITFEELGVDKVFVDEAHYFKNLFLYTKMNNVAGISQTDAKKSSDLYMKSRYLNEVTNGKGVVFATGTPISNSMTELYTMQRYLQFNGLKNNGLAHFDAWASTFGEVQTAVELAPESTGYRAKTRFAKFYNIPELMTMFKEVADIKTGDDLKLPKPDANFHVVQAEPTKLQEQIVESLGERAEKVRGGGVDPTVDNMLKITNDGRLLGLDQRCYDPSLPDEEGSKVNLAVDNIYEVWDKYKEDRLAQLVFCDISTPHGSGEFSVYDDVKQKLIARGVPENEIAFIHDAKTDVQKDKLFAKVRSGEVRVLMGSTFKMGAGTNVQDKLIALHDLDCPWRPSDLEQRLGRILRQGNKQKEVEVFRYVTKGTFDAYLWQLVENKQKFISQIMTSKAPVRSVDDVDDAALSYAEIKSLCIKDPRIKEKMELDVDVAKLKVVRASFLSQKYRLEDDINLHYPSKIKKLEQRIDGYKADIKRVEKFTIPDSESGFSPMVVNGTTYTDKGEAGKALLEACKDIKNTSMTQIGEYRGFKLYLQYEPFKSVKLLHLKGALTHTVELGKSDIGNILRMDNQLKKFDEGLSIAEQELVSVKKNLETANIEVLKEFPQEEELKTKIARLDELDALLRMDEKGGSQHEEEVGVESFVVKDEISKKDISVEDIELLSIAQYNELENMIPHLQAWWLVHNDGTFSDRIRGVYFNNDVYDLNGGSFQEHTVRPALNITADNLSAGDSIKIFDNTWTIIKVDKDNCLALCDEGIGKVTYNGSFVDYKTSDVKSFLNNWLNEKKLELLEIKETVKGDNEVSVESNGLDSVLANAYSRAENYIDGSYEEKSKDLM